MKGRCGVQYSVGEFVDQVSERDGVFVAVAEFQEAAPIAAGHGELLVLKRIGVCADRFAADLAAGAARTVGSGCALDERAEGGVGFFGGNIWHDAAQRDLAVPFALVAWQYEAGVAVVPPHGRVHGVAVERAQRLADGHDERAARRTGDVVVAHHAVHLATVRFDEAGRAREVGQARGFIDSMAPVADEFEVGDLGDDIDVDSVDFHDEKNLTN